MKTAVQAHFIDIVKNRIKLRQWANDDKLLPYRIYTNTPINELLENLKKLTKKEYDALWRHFADNQSYEEIAKKEEITTEAVHSRINRALKKIKGKQMKFKIIRKVQNEMLMEVTDGGNYKGLNGYQFWIKEEDVHNTDAPTIRPSMLSEVVETAMCERALSSQQSA